MPPMIAASCMDLDRHPASRSNTRLITLRGTDANSAAASTNHALNVTQTVNVCNPSQPLMPDTPKAIRQPTANDKPASASAEDLFLVVVANKTPAITVVTSVSQPRKLPVAIVPIPADQGAK